MVPDGRVPDRRRPPQRVGAARLPAPSASCSTRPSWPTTRATSTSRSRHAHRAELDADLARVLRTRTHRRRGSSASPSTCRAVRCSRSTRCSPTRRCSTSSSPDACPHPTRGEIDVLRPPLTFSDTPATVRSGPPADGEHTREVLAELGYSDDEIDDLHASGAVGTHGRRHDDGRTTTPIDTGTEKMLAHVEDGIGWMTYNNPARLNAMSFDMQLAVPRILGAFAGRPRRAGRRRAGRGRARRSCPAPTSPSSARSAPRSRRAPTTTSAARRGVGVVGQGRQADHRHDPRATASAAGCSPRCKPTSASPPRAASSACRRPSSASATATAGSSSS